MKIRVQDNSVRFRITIRELETLAKDGELISSVEFPGTGASFSYGIRIEPDIPNGSIAFDGKAILTTLSPAELSQLQDDSREGIYFRHEPAEEAGKRFIFFIEKDRPSSVCEKPEQWIYEEAGGKVQSLRPIAKKD